MACLGFILAGAETKIRGGRKKIVGAENLIIPRERGRNFNNKSLSKPQLTDLFFMSAMHFLIG